MMPQLGIGLTKNIVSIYDMVYLPKIMVDVYCKRIPYMDLQNTLMDFYNILCRV